MAKDCGVTYYAGDPVPPCLDGKGAFPTSNWWDLLALGIPEFMIFFAFAVLLSLPIIFDLYRFYRTFAIYLFYRWKRRHEERP